MVQADTITTRGVRWGDAGQANGYDVTSSLRRVLIPTERLDSGGGLEIQTLVIAEALASRGWQVRVRTPEPVGDLAERWRLVGAITNGNLDPASIAKELLPEEIVYCHEPHIAAGLHALAADGVPVLVHLHLPAFHLRRGLPATVRGRFRSSIDREAFGPGSRFAGVIAVSQFTAAQWCAGGLPPRLVTVIHNCLDPHRFPAQRPEPTRDREGLGVPPGPVLMYLGRIDPKKGIETALNVHRRLDSGRITLLVMGGPTDALGSDGARYMDRLRASCGAGVLWLGRRKDPLDLIALADIMLVPSRWGEPFGLAAAEALYGGAVPVVFRDGGLPEVLGPQLTQNVVDSETEMTTRVRELLRDPVARQRDQAIGLRRAEGHLHIDRMADELEEAFGRALLRHGSPPSF